VISHSHSLAVLFLWVDDERSRPELHIVQDGARFNESLSVHVLENSDAMHCHNRPQTKADQCYWLSIRKVWLEQKYRKKRSTQSGLIVGIDKLLLPSWKHVDDIQEFAAKTLLLVFKDTFLEQVQTVACSPLERINLCVLVKCRQVSPSLWVVFQLLQKATHADDNVLALEFRVTDSI